MTSRAAPASPAPTVGLSPMTALETASGWVTGRSRLPVDVPPGSPADPLAALEAALAPALERSPCLIQFSGGRDSSVVLAAAVRGARRLGLPEPVAYTRRHPEVPEAEETQWQELVVRHVGVREWERVEIHDELDAVGPVAGPSLQRHGLLWPPLLHQRQLDLAAAAGGATVDGEGGDEILGPGRLAPLAALAAPWMAVGTEDRSVARRGRGALAAALLAAAPNGVRRAALRRLYRAQVQLPWLRPEAWAVLERALAADHAGEPLDFRRELLCHPNSPGVERFVSNYAALGAEHGVLVVHPLLDAGVLAAVGAVGGRTGFRDRTSAMVGLFGSLLPDALLRRPTKAGFNRIAFNVHSRAFAAAWDGTGVDRTLVDVDVVRATWLAEQPHGLSLGLLQQAWLACHEPDRHVPARHVPARPVADGAVAGADG